MTSSALQNTGLWEEPEKATEKSTLKKLGITLPEKDIAGTAFTRLGLSLKQQRQLSRQ